MPGESYANCCGPRSIPIAPAFEVIVIQTENAARTVAAGRSQGAQVDAIGAAMNGVRTTIPGSFRDDLWFDDLTI